MPHLLSAIFAAFGLQTPPHEKPIFRTEVIVTAERGAAPRDDTAAATAMLTRAQLEQLPASSLSEALRFLPGFDVRSGHAFSTRPMVQSRGFFGAGEAEYVQLLVDGVPRQDAESGIAEWQRVRVWDIARIEARRGPSSSLYGDGALGGVIQIFTRRDEPRGGASLSAGSHRSIALDAGIARRQGSALFRGTGTVERTDGFRVNSAAHSAAGTGSIEQAGDGRWRLNVSADRSVVQDPGLLSEAQIRADRRAADPIFNADLETNSRGRAALSFSHASEGMTFTSSAHLAFRMADRTRTLLIAPGVGSTAVRDLSTRTGGVSAQVGKSTATHVIRLGADISREDVRSAYPHVSGHSGVAPDDGRRVRFGTYVSEVWSPFVRLQVSAGLRWDSVSDRSAADTAPRLHQAWSPRLGATYQIAASPQSATSAYFQTARIFKAPTVDQLFDVRPFPDFAGGSFVISNPAIKPQRATNIEAGVRHARARSRVEIVAYRMRVKDEIDFDPRTFTYGNIGQTRHTGVEVDARWREESRISPSIFYAWTRVASIPSQHERQLKNIPRHLWRPAIALRLPREVALTAIYTMSTGAYVDDQNQVPLGGRSVLDLRLMRRFGPVVTKIDVFNLTNDKYEEVGLVLANLRGEQTSYFYPGPGLAARASVEVRF